MTDTEISRRQALTAAAAVAGGATAVAVTASPAAASGAADLVVLNGRVLVMDGRFRVAQALAVRGGRVVALGSNRGIRRLAGSRTRVVDAAGGTVLPGINDSHLHLNALGLTFPPFSYNVDAATIP
jgi:predicted amidohydrolase YtcJ